MRPLVAQGIWLLEDEEEQFICSSVRASRTVLPPSGIMVEEPISAAPQNCCMRKALPVFWASEQRAWS